jgi:putative spermidine/putrescine transport system ATP-binding protein
MSDRIVVINHGKLTQIDTPHNIYNHPVNAFVADFIGESTMLPLNHDGSGKLYFQDHLVETDFKTDAAKDWSLVIRPERLFMAAKEAVDSEKTIIFSGVVRDFVFQGETAFALMSINDKYNLAFRFTTDSSSSQNILQAGDQVSLGLNRSDVIIIPQDDDS